MSPSAPRTLKSAKDGTTRRGLNFAGGAETNATNSLLRKDPSLVFSIVTEARDQTLPGSLLAREILGTRLGDLFTLWAAMFLNGKFPGN